MLEVPLFLLIKPFDTKLKPTISFGPNYQINLTNTSLTYLAGDVTVGFEKQFRYCIIAPGLRYSYSKETKAIYFVIGFK